MMAFERLEMGVSIIASSKGATNPGFAGGWRNKKAELSG